MNEILERWKKQILIKISQAFHEEYQQTKTIFNYKDKGI